MDKAVVQDTAVVVVVAQGKVVVWGRVAAAVAVQGRVAVPPPVAAAVALGMAEEGSQEQSGYSGL